MIYFDTDINMAVGEDIYAALRSERFPNSCVVEGSAPAKRLSLAKGIARALVCTGEERPCGKCSHCRKASAGIHPDIEIYTEDSKGNFSADIAREAVRSISILPNEAPSKVCILVVTGPMSAVSQNILLKSLEEPPKYAYFIIVCPSKADLLTTVISRSRVFSLGEQETELTEEESDAAEEAACNVAKAAASNKEFDIVAACAVFEKNKKLLADTLPVLSEIFVESMKAKEAGVKSEIFRGVPAYLASRMTLDRLIYLEKTSRELKYALENNRNYNLVITRLCTLFRAGI